MRVRLDEYSWPEIRDLLEQDPTVVVPVGATEQHGHHLPLQVDATLCTEVSMRAARRATDSGQTTLVAPAISVGYSPHHMDFPGSLTVSSATFTAVVTDISVSLHRHGFKRIVLVNGHGGNANLLRAATQSLRFEQGVEISAASYWDLALDLITAWRRSPLGGINHACEMETSLMLAVRPDLVRMQHAEDVMPDAHPYRGFDLTHGGSVASASAFSELTRTGAIGAPTFADGERGAELLDSIVEAVAKYLVEGVAGGARSTATSQVRSD
ncbi:MAG: creatininase family protein [Trueperaceae bacterium]